LKCGIPAIISFVRSVTRRAYAPSSDLAPSRDGLTEVPAAEDDSDSFAAGIPVQALGPPDAKEAPGATCRADWRRPDGYWRCVRKPGHNGRHRLRRID